MCSMYAFIPSCPMDGCNPEEGGSEESNSGGLFMHASTNERPMNTVVI